MKTLEINKESKLYLVGEFNDEENYKIENAFKKIKTFEFANNLVFVKDIYGSKEDAEKLYQELESIKDKGLQEILNRRESKTTKLIIYSSLTDSTKILGLPYGSATIKHTFTSTTNLLNILYNKSILKSIRNSMYCIYDIDNLYETYCRLNLISKYSNKYDISSDVLEDIGSYTLIATPIMCTTTEEYLNICVYDYNINKEYSSIISQWESNITKANLSSICDTLYILTATKDNLKSVISKAVYLRMNSGEGTLISIITDLPDEEIKKYDFILSSLEVHHNLISLLVNILA